MTALDRNPTTTDLLQTTKFRLTFDRLKGATYFCQLANLPGVSLTEIPRNTPFVDLFVPGEKIIYDTFNITFLVDEDLFAWRQIHDWIRALTFPTDFDEYRNLARLSKSTSSRASLGVSPQYSDGMLSIYTNKNNLNLKIVMKDMFPISLTSVQFNSQDSADVITTADASFRFSYYNVEKV